LPPFVSRLWRSERRPHPVLAATVYSKKIPGFDELCEHFTRIYAKFTLIGRKLLSGRLSSSRWREFLFYVSGLGRTITAVIVAAALPAAAIAAVPVPSPQPTAQQAAAAASTNPWLALSAMTAGGTASAAAIAGARDDYDDCDRSSSQDDDDDDGCGVVPIAPLSVVLGTIALGVWILVHDQSEDSRGNNNGSSNGGLLGGFINPLTPTPISPA